MCSHIWQLVAAPFDIGRENGIGRFFVLVASLYRSLENDNIGRPKTGRSSAAKKIFLPKSLLIPVAPHAVAPHAVAPPYRSLQFHIFEKSPLRSRQKWSRGCVGTDFLNKFSEKLRTDTKIEIFVNPFLSN